MFARKGRRLLFFATVFIVGCANSCGRGCTGGCGPELLITCETDPDQVQCQDERLACLAQGKQFLSTFEGQRASDNFLRCLAVYDQKKLRRDKMYCAAHHGLILANAQMFLGELNFLFKLALESTLAAPTTGDPRFAPGSPANLASFLPAAGSRYDFNINLENKWASSLEPRLQKIAQYAEAVTQLTEVVDCGFSIGVEPEEIEKFEYVLNFGDNLLPVIQLAFKGRLDGAEARLFGMLARSLLASGDFWLAHSLEMGVDIVNIGYILGLDPGCLEGGTPLDCYEGEFFEYEVNYLDAAFLFQDNPNLLGKSDRWGRRFPGVDNHLAAGFFPMRTFFDALSSRALHWKEQPSLDRQLDEFFILYEDRNDSGEVDDGDTLGINISEIRCSPEFLIQTGELDAQRADDLRATCQSIDEFAVAVLLTMRMSLAISAEAINEIQAFIVRMYDSMQAVDNPGHLYERIPINSFDNVLLSTPVPVLDVYTPNWLELDMASYLIAASPMRDYLPLWHHPFTTFTSSRFALDSDLYNNGVSEHTLAEILFEPTVRSDLGWDLTEERPTLSKPIRSGGTEANPVYIFGMEEPEDCLNSENLTGIIGVREFGWPVMSLAWPDATFGGTVYVTLEAWHSLNPEYLSFGSIDCSDEAGGFIPATNYSLTKGMWQYIAFLWDNFSLAPLLPESTFDFLD